MGVRVLILCVSLCLVTSCDSSKDMTSQAKQEETQILENMPAGEVSLFDCKNLGQWTNTDTSLFKDDHTSTLQGLLNSGQIRLQECYLSLRAPLRATPKQDKGRLALCPQGQQGPKVSVGRNKIWKNRIQKH